MIPKPDIVDRCSNWMYLSTISPSYLKGLFRLQPAASRPVLMILVKVYSSYNRGQAAGFDDLVKSDFKAQHL